MDFQNLFNWNVETLKEKHKPNDNSITASDICE